MRTLARSLAVVLAICLATQFVSAEEADCSVQNSPPTIEQWLGAKEKPICSLKNLVDAPRPTTSWLEEGYFNPPVYPLRYNRCGYSDSWRYVERGIVRLCSRENALGLDVKAMFFGDSLLASCPSLNRDLPGLEDCAMLTKFEFYKSSELKVEQANNSAIKAPRFHAEIHSLLQSQALFKLADVFGADSERLLKPVPRFVRGLSANDWNSNSRTKLSAMTSDIFDSTLGRFELAAITFQPTLHATSEFVTVNLMDSNLDELLITVSNMVVVSDHELLNALSYPKWSVRANLLQMLVDRQPQSPYKARRMLVRDQEYSAQNVWASPPLVAMVISESLLEEPELPKPILEQNYLAQSKKAQPLFDSQVTTGRLALSSRGFSRLARDR